MDPTVVLAGLVGMLAVAAKVVDALRYALDWPRSKSKLLTQLVAWVGATAVVFLYAASDLGTTVDIDGLSLADVNGWTKVLVGLAVGSLASIVTDFATRERDDVPPLVR